jgi:tripartite-type tricarboxylate transporter receptor subunit TctC
MKLIGRWRTVLGIAAGVLLGLGQAAHADAVADFYSGKTIRLVVATPAGGPYDNHARLLARYLGGHIPGHPTIVVENLAGATGMLAANYVYNIGPQDGTVLANLHNMLPLIKALGQSNADVDPARFNWIGNMTREVGDVIVSTKSQVKTIEDAKQLTAVIGAPSPMAMGAIYPRVMNYVLGTKFRVVTGYDGAAGVEHALEQGEVEGDAGDTWFSGQGNTYEWYKAGKIRVLVQIGSRTPDLPDVPLLVDLAGDSDDRALLELFSAPYTIGKPTAVGPKIPPERVAALRAAYAATMADPDFLADAKRLGVTIAPVSGDELADLMTKLMTLPAPLIARASHAIAP